MTTAQARRSEQVMLLLALTMLLLLTAVAMLTRPMTPIDETRYVGVAWEMWLRGDFLVPFKNGEPYSHKPPLMMWMFQAGWAVLGVNEWWPRLVSPLFSAGGILLTLGLAKRLWPERSDVGGHAVVVLVSCLLWTIFSTSAMFDVMLAFFVLMGMHGTLLAADGKARRGFALLGLAIGLGVLAKGPVILLQLLPVVVLAPWWSPGLRWLHWLVGVLAAVVLGAAIALAWAIPAGIAGGEEYRNAIFWGQTANRMVESFAHRRPIWWYLPLLPVLLFPWFVWPELWRGLRQYALHGLDRGGRFCLAWMLPVFIAFSLISGKQVHYLVPLFPAFALLAARVMATGDRPVGKHSGGLWLPTGLMLVTGAGLMGISLGSGSFLHDEIPELPSFLPGLVLAVGGAAAFFVGRRWAQPIIILGLVGVASPALLQIAVAPMLHAAYDVRPIAHAIRQAQDNGHQVAHVGKYHNQYQFFGRLQQPLVVVQENGLKDWLTQHPTALVVVYVSNAHQLGGVTTIALQQYRGKIAALLDASAALRFLTHPKIPEASLK